MADDPNPDATPEAAPDPKRENDAVTKNDRPAYRTERRVFGGTALFLVPWTVLYWASSGDRAGEILLVGCIAALSIVTAYLWVRSARLPPRSEDLAEIPGPAPQAALVDAPREEVHHAPIFSVWPLVMAGAATLLGLGLAFTVWIAVPAGLLLAFAVYGYARET
jgi:hypothetical protein